MLQVSALYVSDPDCWANTLWLSLEQRFTQERISQVQKYLINLGKFCFVQGEPYKETIDRFHKLISDVRSLAPVQVLMAILKEAIIVADIQQLWSHLEFDPVMNVEKMCDIISRWRVAGASSSSTSRPVANLFLTNQI